MDHPVHVKTIRQATSTYDLYSCSGSAAEQNLDDPESLQRAMKRLQLSAGVFQHLQRRRGMDALKSETLTEDLSEETLGVLSDLMVAQVRKSTMHV